MFVVVVEYAASSALEGILFQTSVALSSFCACFSRAGWMGMPVVVNMTEAMRLETKLR